MPDQPVIRRSDQQVTLDELLDHVEPRGCSIEDYDPIPGAYLDATIASERASP